MDIKKFDEAVKALEDACPENMDFADLLGVVIDDVADLFRAKNKQQFMKQKRDARQTLKMFTRKLNNMTFKTRNK